MGLQNRRADEDYRNQHASARSAMREHGRSRRQAYDGDQIRHGASGISFASSLTDDAIDRILSSNGDYSSTSEADIRRVTAFAADLRQQIAQIRGNGRSQCVHAAVGAGGEVISLRVDDDYNDDISASELMPMTLRAIQNAQLNFSSQLDAVQSSLSMDADRMLGQVEEKTPNTDHGINVSAASRIERPGRFDNQVRHDDSAQWENRKRSIR